MSEARIHQATAFKRILDSMKVMIHQVNFHWTRAGISVQSMDSRHVCLVRVNMEAKWFDFFRSEDDLKMGLDLRNLSRIMGMARTDDSMTIRKEKDGDVLNVVFKSPSEYEKNRRNVLYLMVYFFFSGGNRISDFELKLIDIEEEVLNVPTLDYDATIVMSTKDFRDTCVNFGEIGDTVRISATKGEVVFAVKGHIGGGETHMIVSNENDDTDMVEEDDEVRYRTRVRIERPVGLTFSLSYLVRLSKSHVSSLVTFRMMEDYPISVEFGTDRGVSIAYYLAPVIDDDGK